MSAGNDASVLDMVIRVVNQACHVQTPIVNHFHNGPDPFLIQLRCRHTCQRSVAKEQRTIIGFGNLSCFADGERSHSNGDSDRRSAIGGRHGERLGSKPARRAVAGPVCRSRIATCVRQGLELVGCGLSRDNDERVKNVWICKLYGVDGMQYSPKVSCDLLMRGTCFPLLVAPGNRLDSGD